MTLLMYNKVHNIGNLLYNTGFEEDISFSDNNIKNWAAEIQSTGLVFQQDIVKFEGDRSVNLTTKAKIEDLSPVAEVNQKISLNTADISNYYCISMVAIGEPAGAQNLYVEFNIIGYSADGKVISHHDQQYQLFVRSKNYWNLTYATVKMPRLKPDVMMVDLVVRIKAIGPNSNYYVDNVKLEGGLNPSRYSDNEGNFSSYNSFQVLPGILAEGAPPTPTPTSTSSSTPTGGYGGGSSHIGSFNKMDMVPTEATSDEDDSKKDCINEVIIVLEHELEIEEDEEQELINEEPPRWGRTLDETEIEREEIRECLDDEDEIRFRGVLAHSLDRLNAIRREIEMRYQSPLNNWVWSSIDAHVKTQYAKHSLDRIIVEATP